jgi:hypothetical protein
MPSPVPTLSTLKSLLADYESKSTIDLSLRNSDPEHALTRYLLYYLMPLWMAAGLVDWYWHKDTDIEHTAGAKESLIHLLMFTEVGVPIIMGLLLEINAGVIASMAGALVVHEATAFWDVAYATDHRNVKPREQHTHSFLEVLPFMALSMASCLHWDQFRSLFGVGKEKPKWGIKLKKERLPTPYLLGIVGLIVGGIVLPYGNELYRCWKARNEPRFNGSCTPVDRP